MPIYARGAYFYSDSDRYRQDEIFRLCPLQSTRLCRLFCCFCAKRVLPRTDFPGSRKIFNLHNSLSCFYFYSTGCYSLSQNKTEALIQFISLSRLNQVICRLAYLRVSVITLSFVGLKYSKPNSFSLLSDIPDFFNFFISFNQPS